MTELPGIGIDVIEIGRLERAINRRPRLRERLFSTGELEFADSRRRPGRHLAARFAAKEAAVKALGLRGMRLHEVEVEGGGDRPPALRLSGEAARAAERAGIRLSVSLSHERELAVAVVAAAPVAAETG